MNRFWRIAGFAFVLLAFGAFTLWDRWREPVQQRAALDEWLGCLEKVAVRPGFAKEAYPALVRDAQRDCRSKAQRLKRAPSVETEVREEAGVYVVEMTGSVEGRAGTVSTKRTVRIPR